MLVTCYLSLVTCYSSLVTRHLLLVAGSWLLAPGCWLLVTGYRWLATGRHGGRPYLHQATIIYILNIEYRTRNFEQQKFYQS